MSFPFYKQLDSKDCGPTCLRMIAAFYGKRISSKYARMICGQYKNGSSLLSIKTGAEKLGLTAIGARLTKSRFLENVNSPCIVQINKNHFVIVYLLTNNQVFVADPAIGLLQYGIDKFFEIWLSHVNNEGNVSGVVMFFEPSIQFDTEPLTSSDIKHNISFLKFLTPQKKLIIQLCICTTVRDSVFKLVCKVPNFAIKFELWIK